jgi:hypothetical protein
MTMGLTAAQGQFVARPEPTRLVRSLLSTAHSALTPRGESILDRWPSTTTTAPDSSGPRMQPRGRPSHRRSDRLHPGGVGRQAHPGHGRLPVDVGDWPIREGLLEPEVVPDDLGGVEVAVFTPPKRSLVLVAYLLVAAQPAFVDSGLLGFVFWLEASDVSSEVLGAFSIRRLRPRHRARGRRDPSSDARGRALARSGTSSRTRSPRTQCCHQAEGPLPAQSRARTSSTSTSCNGSWPPPHRDDRAVPPPRPGSRHGGQALGPLGLRDGFREGREHPQGRLSVWGALGEPSPFRTSRLAGAPPGLRLFPALPYKGDDRNRTGVDGFAACPGPKLTATQPNPTR